MPTDQPAGWIVMITAIATAVAVCANVVLQLLARAEATRVAERLAAQTKQVATVLADSNSSTEIKLARIAKVGEENKKVGEAVHVLVNSAMSAQLKIAAVALRRIAELTKDPEDAKAAALAEAAFSDHEAKQATVDRGEKIVPEPPGAPRPGERFRS
jgi:hypothetical protein